MRPQKVFSFPLAAYGFESMERFLEAVSLLSKCSAGVMPELKGAVSRWQIWYSI